MTIRADRYNIPVTFKRAAEPPDNHQWLCSDYSFGKVGITNRTSNSSITEQIPEPRVSSTTVKRDPRTLRTQICSDRFHKKRHAQVWIVNKQCFGHELQPTPTVTDAAMSVRIINFDGYYLGHRQPGILRNLLKQDHPDFSAASASLRIRYVATKNWVHGHQVANTQSRMQQGLVILPSRIYDDLLDISCLPDGRLGREWNSDLNLSETRALKRKIFTSNM